MKLEKYESRSDFMRNLHARALLRPSVVLVSSVVLWSCAGAKPAKTRHAAHGHAVAAIAHADGDAPMMLERVEDEDTRWIELPDFGECPYDAGSIPPHTPIDDGHVPGLSPGRSRLTNMVFERRLVPEDRQLHLRGVRCAARIGDQLGVDAAGVRSIG